MSDCLFCKIIAGEIPSFKIYEDDDVLAFLDAFPSTKGHTLVIPKKHSTNILEMDGPDSAALFAKAHMISKILGEKLGVQDFNFINNCGIKAGQSVFHTHIHIIPRYDESDGINLKFNTKELDLAQIQKLITE